VPIRIGLRERQTQRREEQNQRPPHHLDSDNSA
jgi:hypothetical protein